VRGKFITFEGIDGSGKSTQLRMLVDLLRAKGTDVVATCEPGGTDLGRELRRVFLESGERVVPRAELLLFAADRSQHVDLLIKPSLDAGKVVISDRYADATLAYQGAGRGFSERLVREIIEVATEGLKPDLTLFFDLPTAKAINRMDSRRGSETNRMDAEGEAFYERVRMAYLGVAAAEPARFRTIDADRSIEAIHEDVRAHVEELLGN
jgi:dTMP kinase